MNEQTVVFGSDCQLVGVLTPAGDGASSLPAVVLLNAGLTHHVGPNRLSVRLARELAELGFPALRFDFSGVGDSPPRRDTLAPEKSVFVETKEAMDYLERAHGHRRFVLLGMCSGATISYLAARSEPRVVGVAMINAQGHLHGFDPELSRELRRRSLARHSRRIALKSSFRRKNWRKALRGQIEISKVVRMLFGNLLHRGGASSRSEPVGAAADPVGGMRELAERGVRLLHVYSEGDEGLDYFHVVLGEERLAEIERDGLSRIEIIPGANHMFTLRWSQDRLSRMMREWAEELRLQLVGEAS